MRRLLFIFMLVVLCSFVVADQIIFDDFDDNSYANQGWTLQSGTVTESGTTINSNDGNGGRLNRTFTNISFWDYAWEYSASTKKTDNAVDYTRTYIYDDENVSNYIILSHGTNPNNLFQFLCQGNCSCTGYNVDQGYDTNYHTTKFEFNAFTKNVTGSWGGTEKFNQQITGCTLNGGIFVLQVRSDDSFFDWVNITATPLDITPPTITEILITSGVVTATNITDGTIGQTTDSTTTFNLTTNESTTCGMNRTNTTFTECSTTGGTAHICTLTTVQQLSIGNNNIFWECTDAFGNNRTTNRTVEYVSTSVNLSLEGFTINITAELGSDIDLIASIYSFGTVCVDIDHPLYGINYSCETNTTSFTFNISWFRNIDMFSWLEKSGGNHGAVTGATWTSSGKYGGAYEFDGTNDYINTSPVNLNLDNFSDLTIGFWFNFDSKQPSVQLLMEQYEVGDTVNWFMFYNAVDGGSAESIRFSTTDSGGVSNGNCRTRYSNDFHPTGWKYVTMVLDKDTSCKFYIDGVLNRSSTTHGKGNYTTNNPLTIGTDRAVQYWLNNTMDEVRIWNKTLTQTEIQAEMDSNIPLVSDNLVDYWSFNKYDRNATHTFDLGFSEGVSKNITFDGSQNHTIYIEFHQYDDVVNMTLNVTGYISGGTFPKDVKLYINDTFSNNIGDLQGNLTTFNDSSTVKNLTFTTEATQVIGYLRLPKNTTITSASFTLEGFNHTYYQATADNQTYTSGDTTCFVVPTYEKKNRTFLAWDVKHGTLDRYNITSVDDCFTYANDYLQFRFEVRADGTASSSQPQCYNGSTWVDIGSFQTGAGDNVKSRSGGASFFDNDYETRSCLVCTGYYSCSGYGEWIINTDTGPGSDYSCDSFSGLKYNRIYEEGVWWTSYTRNPWMEIGSVNGSRVWNYTGLLNTINVTGDFTTRLQDELANCVDVGGICNIPVNIYSDTGGIIEVSNIEIIYSVDVINPINVNLAVLGGFLGNSSGVVNVPLTFESSQSGAIYVDDIKYDYAGGNDTINVTAHTTDYATTSEIDITYYYSNWFLQLPEHVDYIEFIPKSSTQKNVTPYGQTNSRPIINITATNYGGKLFNFTVQMNESFSCGNDTLSLTNNKSAGVLLSNTSWLSYTNNIDYLGTFDIYAWSDFSCNYSSWYLWEPYWMFRACCVGCSVCDDSTTNLELV